MKWLVHGSDAKIATDGLQNEKLYNLQKILYSQLQNEHVVILEITIIAHLVKQRTIMNTRAINRIKSVEEEPSEYTNRTPRLVALTEASRSRTSKQGPFLTATTQTLDENQTVIYSFLKQHGGRDTASV